MSTFASRDRGTVQEASGMKPTRMADDRPGLRTATRALLRRPFVAGVAVLSAAVLIGSAGGAGAAGLLTGKNIVDDSLRSADFGDSSIGGVKFRDGSLTPADVAFDVTGDPGPVGAQGPIGVPGIGHVTLRTGPQASSDAAGQFMAEANCATGEIALSGGAQLDTAAAGTQPYIVFSYLTAAQTGWDTFITGAAGTKQYTPWVVCAPVP